MAVTTGVDAPYKTHVWAVYSPLSGQQPNICCILQEAGFNALHFNQMANSWVRNVKFVNTDSAFYCW
jgi:hypothetical protein